MSRVLIIDDSATAVEKVRRVLVDERHTVESLSRMIELGGMLRTSPPDVVLLDLRMPGLSGDGFARLIHRFSAGRIPIIVYSSENRKQLAASAQELHAFSWVHKSDSDDTLREAVRRALEAADPALEAGRSRR